MEYIVKDQKQMIQYLHKQAEEHAKTNTNVNRMKNLRRIYMTRSIKANN